MTAVTRSINLDQLSGEFRAAGLPGQLFLEADDLTAVEADGSRRDLTAQEEGLVNAHVAMRDVTDAEYAAEFQNPSTTAARRQEIRDITAGLLPREQVPVDGPPPPPHGKADHIAEVKAAATFQELHDAVVAEFEAVR